MTVFVAVFAAYLIALLFFWCLMRAAAGGNR